MIKIPNQSVENASYYRSSYRYSSISRLHDIGKMHGARRVATFCILTAFLPTILIIIPLYLRHSLFADVFYQVAESDVIEIREGISSIFCQEHVLTMNSSFSAYQLSSLPEISNNRKHIRLKKSMSLPDDTLEYWGFYLLKGATVALKVCSRFEGSRILVVRGERNLRTCGLLEHNLNKIGPHFDSEHKQVHVTFETAAQEIFGESHTKTRSNTTFQDLNTGEEELDDEKDEEINILRKYVETFIEKRRNKNLTAPEQSVVVRNCLDEKDKVCDNIKNEEIKHNKRHERKRLEEMGEQNLESHKTSEIKPESFIRRRRNADVISELKEKTLENIQIDKKKLENYVKAKKYETENVRQHRRDDIEYSTNKDKENNQYLAKSMPKKYSRRLSLKQLDEIRKLKMQLEEGDNIRKKRETGHKLDGAIGHGGTAINHTEVPSVESSISSFENNLLTCYDGQILLTQAFAPSHKCNDVHYLDKGDHMQMIHEVSSDGYYYYIFYSDNDIKVNDIHAVFDIHKPTFQYTNISDSKQCVNSTECNFSVSFFSGETVIVEIPTRDGIEHEEDDITLLVSVCKPRMAIYIIFPVTILFLILGCAFL